jgi:N-acetylmuramoyl-L-alanine amidase
MVVLHHTAMVSAKAAIERLCDPEFEVSAHYVISETGAITQLVSEDMRAWHAGAGAWGDVLDVNSHSIGIELANSASLGGFPPFPAPQMDALEDLLAQILERWSIDPSRVIGHSDMAPARKADPGHKFDWQRLARKGLSVWPDQTHSSADPDAFLRAAVEFGYSVPKNGVDHTDLLNAFRLRFRPNVLGPLDTCDVGMMENLAAHWSCKTPTFQDT